MGHEYRITVIPAGEIGPRGATGRDHCVTVDFDSLEDRAVTVRDRGSMAQDRVPLAELETFMRQKIMG